MLSVPCEMAHKKLVATKRWVAYSAEFACRFSDVYVSNCLIFLLQTNLYGNPHVNCAKSHKWKHKIRSWSAGKVFYGMSKWLFLIATLPQFGWLLIFLLCFVTVAQWQGFSNLLLQSSRLFFFSQPVLVHSSKNIIVTFRQYSFWMLVICS